jgi:hypothetical protein
VTTRLCQRCTKRPPVPREKYCPPCRDTVLQQIGRTGYFEPRVRFGRPRHPEAREAQAETRGKTPHD